MVLTSSRNEYRVAETTNTITPKQQTRKIYNVPLLTSLAFVLRDSDSERAD
jgi:hypothetical protein